MLPVWQYPDGYLEFVSRTQPDPDEVYGSTEGEHDFESARIMFSGMPSFLTEDPYIRDLLWAQGIELDALHAALDELLAAQFLSFAPEWGLRLWEEFTGLLVAPAGLTEAQRRALVKAEINQAQRTLADFVSFTIGFFGVLESQVVITEDFPNYEVEVVVQVGLSTSQQEAFEFAFRRILPAHLDVTFGYGGFIAGVSLAGDTV